MQAFFYIWRGRVLYIGPVPELALHTHMAAAVCLGVNGPLELRVSPGEKWTAHEIALIPPRSPHALRVPHGPAAFLFLDPGSPFYERLFAGRTHYGEWTGEDARAMRENTLRLSAGGLDEKETEKILNRMPLPEFGGSGDSLDKLYGDERIAGVVREILDAPDRAPSLEDLASRAGMSSSRLAHVFRDRVGIPIRALRTWFRLKTAAIWFKRGYSLTDAALMAGFYDSPHFARKFREMFGIAPSLILNRRLDIEWYIESEELTLELRNSPIRSA